MPQNITRLLSFIIPVKNEQDTIEELCSQIIEAVKALGASFNAEIIFVDDGSDDHSWEIMRALSDRCPGEVLAIRLRRNCGKAVALETGFRTARGEIIFTMDADLQDDPKEIPRFIEKLAQGFDLVSGWKKSRHDPLSKTLPSRLFNKVTSWATDVKLHDFNCGFKAYRREVIESIRLYGELHRYIPVLAHDYGYRIGEIEINHRPRKHGVSKYGLERYVRGFVDLLTVLATTRWMSKPGHLFGGIGAFLGIIGGAVLIHLSALWLMGRGPIGGRPLLLFGVMLCVFSLQMFSLGIIAEFFIKAGSAYSIDAYVAEKYGCQKRGALNG